MLVPDNSILIIDKPLYWSSFDVIRYLKREYRRNTPKEEQIKRFKIGHAGTLDPLATGLLIVCTGKQTKSINVFMGQTKEYYAEVVFGATTPSFDSEFEPTDFCSTEGLTIQSIQSVIPHFIGTIDQIPPIYSAIHINGKRAYELAQNSHKDALPELKPRQVYIESITITDETLTKKSYSNHSLKSITLKIVCSKGTYIRSLARDLGEKLGTGAYLGSLRRTKIGEFDITEAIAIMDTDFVPSVQTRISNSN